MHECVCMWVPCDSIQGVFLPVWSPSVPRLLIHGDPDEDKVTTEYERMDDLNLL